VGFFILLNIYNKNVIMDKSILNEVNEIKYLFNYNRTKTLNEQQNPTPTGSTVGSGPVPAPTGSTVGPGAVPAPTSSNSTEQTPTPEPATTSSNSTEQTPNENGGPVQPVEKTPINPTAMSASRIEQGKPNDPYQYKFEDDGNVQKYYYAKKGTNNWKQSVTPKSVEAIKKNVFGIN
jgi:hypothetical protein